jgi:hypothetical protein
MGRPEGTDHQFGPIQSKIPGAITGPNLQQKNPGILYPGFFLAISLIRR